MPSTINGVGTHYYGKHDLQTRPGTCPFCRRSVTLSSFNTRLWFVVLFVPIIPLGRKRITDSCPSCRRHYVAELQKWETARQLETSGALEKFRSDPTPENAVEAHRQFVAFHQHDEAAAMQQAMCEKFPENARIQVYLGATLTALGRVKESEPFFERAFQLRPDLPEARVGIARAHIRAKRLDEARALLDFLEKPGAAQLYSLSPLEQLAIAYQAAGRHAQALELFQRLLAELPVLADNKNFRKLVKKSETTGPSILPKTKFSFRRLFQRSQPTRPGRASPRTVLIIIVSAIVLIIGSFWLSGIYSRHHRHLYIVNGFRQPVDVALSNRELVHAASGVSLVTLPEGHYDAVLGGPIDEHVSFDISTASSSRWFGKPVWLLNPGGHALIAYIIAPYSKNPHPGTVSYFYGKSFQPVLNATHPFTPLPKTVSLDSAGTEKILTSLELVHTSPVNAFATLQQTRRTSDALDLAEWRLRSDPDDHEMLSAYVNAATSPHELPRIQDFLHAAISSPGTPIEWHRTYQDLLSYRALPPATVFAEYNTLLQTDPTNSDYLYLCGRALEDKSQSDAYFTRSLAANPANPYPMYAIAYDLMVQGDWASAKPAFERVVELLPNDDNFREVWKLAHLATQDYSGPETVYRKLIEERPTRWTYSRDLCDILVAQGKTDEANQVMIALVRSVATVAPTSEEEIRSAIYLHYYYATGDFTTLEQNARRDKTVSARVYLFASLVEQNHLDDAAALYPNKDFPSPELPLALSVAYRLNHQDSPADEMRDAFVTALRKQGGRNARLITALNHKTDVTPADFEALYLPMSSRAAILVDAALTHPELHDQLLKTARAINVDPAFPYHLIRRATTTQP